MLQSKHYKLFVSLLLAVTPFAAANAAVARKPIVARPISLITRRPAPITAGAPHVASTTAPVLPTLNWQKRSDWVDVKTDVSPAAVGDGVHDDTQAIQTALNRLNDLEVSSTKTVYFPPGTYRITNTLSFTELQGTLLIGTGATTRIVWDGPLNQSMFRSNGSTRSRYVGLVWDGANKAGVGIDHQTHTYYEERIRHQDEAFVNFRVAGIRIGMNQIVPTADVIYRNCLFQNSGTGVSILDWNDYCNDFDGCDFRDCGTAINCTRGNLYARECHFERSSILDILIPAHSSSVRRCTSIGSAQFLRTEAGGSSCETTVQDCHIDGWTSSLGAMSFGYHGPTTVFDTSFTHPPSTAAPIRLTNPGDFPQLAILSNNTAPGSSTLVDLGQNGQVMQLPAGARGPSLSNPTQTFFQTSESLPGTILDVKTQYGAKGDGHADDTDAITRAIAAAKALGNNALVYLPPGLYNVSSTISVTGGGYTIGGSGFWTLLQWTGARTGTMFSVQDPQSVTMEQIRMTAPNTVACIQQTSLNSTMPSRMTYDGVYVPGENLGTNKDGTPILARALECNGLSANSVVRLPHFDGSMHFTNCSAATILASFSVAGVLQVDGSQSEKSGFLGFLERTNSSNVCDIVVRDNQDLVGTNYYTEQTGSLLQASGDGAYPGQPGHITIQATELQLDDPNCIRINDYEGRIGILSGQFISRMGISGAPFLYGPGATGYSISQTGTRPVDLLMLGNTFFNFDPTFVGGPGLNLSVIQNLVNGDNIATGSAHPIANAVPGVNSSLVESLVNPSTNISVMSQPAVTAGLSDSVSALDDFRQLGAVDLALNHP